MIKGGLPKIKDRDDTLRGKEIVGGKKK